MCILGYSNFQINTRWIKKCEIWQDTQETSRLREIWAHYGYVPDWLDANYLDPEVIDLC